MKFRRQHPIAGFIVDSYAVSHRLVVEVDGEVHEAQALEDATRTRILAAHGVRVLRLRNAEVLGDCERVLLEIAWALGTEMHRAERRERPTNLPSPDPGKVGETRVGRGLLRASDAPRGEGKKR